MLRSSGVRVTVTVRRRGFSLSMAPGHLKPVFIFKAIGRYGS